MFGDIAVSRGQDQQIMKKGKEMEQGGNASNEVSEGGREGTSQSLPLHKRRLRSSYLGSGDYPWQTGQAVKTFSITESAGIST